MAARDHSLKNSKVISALPAMLVTVPLGVIYYVYTDAPVVSVFVGTFLACLSAFYAMANCRRREAFLLFAVFAIKFVLTAYQALNKNLPLGGEDWGNYHAGAQLLIKETNGDIFKMLFFGKRDLFTEICAVIYKIFGVHTRQIYLYVLASSFVAVNYVFKTVEIMTDGDYIASSLASIAFAVWPIDIIYSVTYLREMPIQMLAVMSFYFFIKFIKTRKFTEFVLSFICIAAACMMHSGVIALAVLYIVCFSLREGDSITKVFRFQYLVPVVIVILMLTVTPLWKSMFAKIGDFSSFDDVVERAGQFNEDVANTQYVSALPQSAWQFIVQAPYRAVLFAFVPLPWMIINFNTALSWVLDAVPQVFIVYRMFRLLKMTRRSTKYRLYVSLFVLAVVATYVICGMGTTAYGNAIRHRAKILPVVLSFVIGLYTHIEEDIRHADARHGYNSRIQRRING